MSSFFLYVGHADFMRKCTTVPRVDLLFNSVFFFLRCVLVVGGTKCKDFLPHSFDYCFVVVVVELLLSPPYESTVCTITVYGDGLRSEGQSAQQYRVGKPRRECRSTLSPRNAIVVTVHRHPTGAHTLRTVE